MASHPRQFEFSATTVRTFNLALHSHLYRTVILHKEKFQKPFT